MSHKKFTAILVLICLHFACTSGRNSARLSPDIFNHWVHSHEENVGDVDYYRPTTYQFPRSRGRQGFEFKKNGRFILYAIAPADGQERLVGTWRFLPPDSIAAEFPPQSQQQFRFQIVSCEKGLLKIRK